MLRHLPVTVDAVEAQFLMESPEKAGMSVRRRRMATVAGFRPPFGEIERVKPMNGSRKIQRSGGRFLGRFRLTMAFPAGYRVSVFGPGFQAGSADPVMYR